MSRKRRRKNRTGAFAAVIFCLLVILGLLLGARKLLRHLGSYGTTAITAAPEEPEPENQPPQVQPDGGPVLEGLPLSSLEADKFRDEGGFRRYDGLAKGRVGIDVSSHQEKIDWDLVSSSGVQFAMIRLGYRGYGSGALQLDTYFEDNFRGAQQAGLDVGVYFFSQAITAEEAVEEAEFVLEQLQGAQLAYPIVFDWEDVEAEARTDGMDRLLLTACADAFCARIEQAGYRAGVYFNQIFGYQELNLLSLRDYVFWLAEYSDVPSFLYDVQMWQYTSEGRVDGITGDVDLNLSFGKP